MKKKYLFILFVATLGACKQNNTQSEQTSSATDITATTDNYLHKEAIIENVGTQTHVSTEITGKQAAAFAVKNLEGRGIKNIQICVVGWIAAPLGGYLIDAKGNWSQENANYSTFRIGITDGSEEVEGKFSIREEFVFIALGKDKAGNKTWFPTPGPNYSDSINPDVPMEYEFLYNAEDIKGFENLQERFK